MNLWKECPFVLVRKQRYAHGAPVKGKYIEHNPICSLLKQDGECPGGCEQ